jgi:hypothetical protein
MPPSPKGISGGAAFHVVPDGLTLAAIMTEHRPHARVIVGTRMQRVIEFVAEVIASEGL